MTRIGHRRPAVLAGVLLLALVVHARARQPGLLYPDGYQYLLMARGIGAHLTPTVALGAGGELFVPSVDAALKPLFPALVALLTPLAGARGAADAIALVAAVATTGLVAALAHRLTRSLLAAAAAAGAAIVSPALVYWSGFTGPDQLAVALALAAALAAAGRRPAAAGVLGGLCAATRPEWGLLLASAALAALLAPATRPSGHRALLAGAFTLAGIVVVLRPPLAVPAGGAGLLAGALLAGTALQLAAVWAAATPRRATAAAAATLVALVVAARLARVTAAGDLLRSDWPLLALAAAGVLRACRGGGARPALQLLAAAAFLGAVYAYRNPGSERYLAQLLPLACVAAGLGLAPHRRGAVGPGPAVARPRRVGSAVAVVAAAGAVAVLLVAATAAPRPRLGDDAFAALAGPLRAAPPGTLVSAAPDAYGYLLPGRPQRTLRPGAWGLVLLDGAQRAYAPGLTACGRVLAELPAGRGFLRPDGILDRRPAVLVRGVVRAGRRQPGPGACRPRARQGS